MEDGSTSGCETVLIKKQYGDQITHRYYPEKSVHFDAAQSYHEPCIDIASDACTRMDRLLHHENAWHDKGHFLRLNKKKCEDLLSFLEQAKQSYHSNTLKFAAREFLATVTRAGFLVEESSRNEWLLKAVELWECSQHFIEVLMDLFWWAHIMSLGINNTCKQTNCWLEDQLEKQLINPGKHTEQFSKAESDDKRTLVTETLLKSQSDDRKALEAMVEATLLDSTLKSGSAEHQLACLLDDRLRDQKSWSPPLLKKFTFCISCRFSLRSRGSAKSGQPRVVVLRFQWVYKKQFALKMRRPNTPIVEDMFRHEFEILDKFRSPYIVGVVGYWELQSRLDMSRRTTLCPFLLMESMECDLEGLITKHRGTSREGFSPLETIKLMLPVAKALQFLHDNDVAHRDIKPQNIMCSNAMGDFDDATVKLIDFDVARVGASEIPSDKAGIAGTNGYMDPAMLTMDPQTRKREENPAGFDLLRADVFSFAMVFAELLSWRWPWKNIRRGDRDWSRQVQDRLYYGERPPLPKDLPDYVSFIVQCCWCADPPARPTFTDICSMLQSAKLLLLDENFSVKRDDLFRYEDGDCVTRAIGNQAFLRSTS